MKTITVLFSLMMVLVGAGSYVAAATLPESNSDFNIVSDSDRDNIAIPRFPEVSVGRHLEMIGAESLSRDDLKLRSGSAGERVYDSNIDAVVIIFTEEGSGSGAILDPRGFIVTNWHVVQGSSTVGVKLHPKQSGIRFQAGYIGDVIAVEKSKDLALVRFRTPPEGLAPVMLGDIQDVRVGMTVHAIGHPANKWWTYTTGVVSQIRKGYEWTYSDQTRHKATVIQTQTPINPGNSGGPLFSDTGKLIGINSFGNSEYEGLNFAVAIDELLDFLGASSSPDSTQADKPFPEPLKRYADWEGDQDQDGKADIYGFDTDRNGQLDLYAVDEDQNNVADYWLLDVNENRVPDGTIVDAKTVEPDKTGYVWLIDADENDEAELMGFDHDSDGEIDRLVPL